jgi:hypothetical protein
MEDVKFRNSSTFVLLWEVHGVSLPGKFSAWFPRVHLAQCFTAASPLAFHGLTLTAAFPSAPCLSSHDSAATTRVVLWCIPPSCSYNTYYTGNNNIYFSKCRKKLREIK